MGATRAARTVTTGLAGLLLLVLLAPADAAAAGVAAADQTPGEAGPERGAVSAVLVNVGNASPHCAPQGHKLCLRSVEERVAAGLAETDPDLVALLETLPPRRCERTLTLSPFNVCSRSDQDPPQAQRLLAHDDYDIVCAERHASDCLAVRSSLGSIVGCEGGYCGTVSEHTAESVAAREGCSSGFESFVTPVELGDTVLHVGVSHANARDVACRNEELTTLFEQADRDDRESLVLTDANLDPYRQPEEAAVAWDRFVGEDRPFTLLSGAAEHDPPHFTIRPQETAQLDPTGRLPLNLSLDVVRPYGATIDHVLVSDGLGGACTTLGEAPGSERLEGPRGGLDHRALDCEVTGVGAG